MRLTSISPNNSQVGLDIVQCGGAPLAGALIKGVDGLQHPSPLLGLGEPQAGVSVILFYRESGRLGGAEKLSLFDAVHGLGLDPDKMGKGDIVAMELLGAHGADQLLTDGAALSSDIII